MKEKFKKALESFGLPRIIIVAFFIVLFIIAAGYGMNLPSLFSDVIRRWGMYGILVLAMVPAVQCGIGLNFGITLGIVGGILGGLIVVEMDIARNFPMGPWVAVLVAMIIGLIISSILGYFYGLVLNKVKGSEMTVSTYVGFSVIAFMNIMWLVLPFKSGTLIWPVSGDGLRNTISLDGSFIKVFNRTLDFSIGGVYIPTGLLLFFFFTCFIVWLFLKSKSGMAMAAAGANPVFAKASGINVNKMRILGTVVSTALGAVGIIIYAQSYGFIQIYNAPLMMGFHCVAAVLVGGASIVRAKISHVILGTFLYQGLLAVALPVANSILPEGNLSDVMRLIISNGIILYALTKTGGGNTRE
ncbi:ABC transporter permease subunit [Alloiococcus sp. CFN-8]|uniref:ABC transporter permease subunit n=1 Tax=Alloiococcus sp. CFN-8 TaxID=3416081 RepID=UPI003CF0445E